MGLGTIPGQPRAVSQLQAALRHGTVHHAYLFAGPGGVGKELTALAFIQALLCPDRPDEGCGVCSTCRRVERFSHPDVSWLLPESEQVSRGMAGKSDFDHVPSREIRVEQVRKLQERLSMRPLECKRKAALVLSADLMNVQAQNAFLKTLEEPTPDTVLVLVAAAPDRLLTTLRSRCSRIQFGPLPEDLIAKRVATENKTDEATARLVARMADGSVTRALQIDVEQLAQRKALFERYEALKGDDFRGILRFAEDLGGSREDAEAALQLLLVWTRDLTLIQSGSRELINADLVDFAQSAAAKHSGATLHRRYRLIDQTLHAIGVRNGGARLQLERMALEMVGGEAP